MEQTVRMSTASGGPSGDSTETPGSKPAAETGAAARKPAPSEKVKGKSAKSKKPRRPGGGGGGGGI